MGIEINLIFVRGVEIDLVFVCGPKMTCFEYGDRLTWFLCGWSKMTWSLCAVCGRQGTFGVHPLVSYGDMDLGV